MAVAPAACNLPTGAYPNVLATSEILDRPWRPGLLALLLLVTFLPRAWEAVRCDVLWCDSLVYHQASEAIRQGDFQRAIETADLGLNLYPAILAGLEDLGLDWEIAGRWWNVVMATLAVLPIWGLVRRQFDDRVALGACLVYALHGKLIAMTPLVLRDATFWLLFLTTLYLLWRAAAEIRLRCFLLAGLTLTLAVHTRTEGWPLLVPLVGWTMVRLGSAQRRWRLLAGSLLCLAVLPACLVLLNCTWLRHHPHWELLRPQHARIALQWWQARIEEKSGEAKATAVPLAAKSPGEAVAGPDGSDDPPDSERSALTLARKLLVRLVKGYTYVGGLLTLLGIFSCGKLLLRRDHLVLALMWLALLVMIWVRYAQVPEIDIRYFMPMVFVALPWMALGFFWLVEHARRRLQSRMEWTPARDALLVGGLIAAAAVGSLADGRLSGARMMQRQAELGRWIRDHLGPEQSIGHELSRPIMLVDYWAEGRPVPAYHFAQRAPGNLSPELSSGSVDVVVLYANEQRQAAVADIEAHLIEKLGYRRVSQDALPPTCEEFHLLVRSGKRWWDGG